jgi:hypothetical protein
VLDAHRVELAPGAAAQLGERVVDRHRRAVGPLARHRVERIRDVEDPRLERDRVAREERAAKTGGRKKNPASGLLTPPSHAVTP